MASPAVSVDLRASQPELGPRIPHVATVIWHRALVSSYGIGDGTMGHGMACGGRLTMGGLTVAHQTLPCGTKVVLRYKGFSVTATVRDRGPYCCPLWCRAPHCSRTFDLAPATCRRIHACGLAVISWRRLG